jgi:ferrous iron transport protein A
MCGERVRGWHIGSRRPVDRGACGEHAGTLAFLRRGQDVVIAEIPDDRVRAQAMRFGMGVGASVRCVTALPGGPIVLRLGRQEIAVGRGLARRIRVGESAGVSCDCS